MNAEDKLRLLMESGVITQKDLNSVSTSPGTDEQKAIVDIVHDWFCVSDNHESEASSKYCGYYKEKEDWNGEWHLRWFRVLVLLEESGSILISRHFVQKVTEVLNLFESQIPAIKQVIITIMSNRKELQFLEVKP